MPVSSTSLPMPYALSMPRVVTSTEVDPPPRTSSSGTSGATASRRAAFFVPSGSHARLASRGASCPSAEKVICDPRFSMICPHGFSSHSPRARAWRSSEDTARAARSGSRS